MVEGPVLAWKRRLGWQKPDLERVCILCELWGGLMDQARGGRRGCTGVDGAESEVDGMGSVVGLAGAGSKEDPRAGELGGRSKDRTWQARQA